MKGVVIIRPWQCEVDQALLGRRSAKGVSCPDPQWMVAVGYEVGALVFYLAAYMFLCKVASPGLCMRTQ